VRKEKKKKMNGLEIGVKNCRGDVVLKTILRTMRKTYLEEFNKTTKYIKTKRY
jgi:hypothetical protein